MTLLNALNADDAAGAGGGPLFIVDGFNLLHAVVLRGKDRARWWSASNQERVVGLLEGFAGGELLLVFDSGSDAERFEGQASIPIEFAANADDHIVDAVTRLASGRPVTLVTADRALADRARHRGAAVLSPWKFVELLSHAGLK